MYSSSYYRSKILKFQGYKAKVSPITEKAAAVSASLNRTSKYTDAVIFCGESIDKGSLKNVVQAGISTIEDDVQTVINECNRWIEYYGELYHRALVHEEYERQKALRNRAVKV